MTELDVALAGGGLVLGVVAGLVAHECSHAAALRAAGVDYAVEFFPDRNGTVLGLLASCPWAAVRPLPTERDAAWTLRVAALTPLLLALPIALLGVAGHSLSTDAPAVTALSIGWLACAIPSPQDFSVVFHAHALLEDATATDDATAVVPGTRTD